MLFLIYLDIRSFFGRGTKQTNELSFGVARRFATHAKEELTGQIEPGSGAPVLFSLLIDRKGNCTLSVRVLMNLGFVF